MKRQDQPTAEEIEHLKAQWLTDPHWDLEETEGYDAYREGLLAFRLQVEADRRAEAEAEVQAKLQDMGLRDNRRLGEWLLDVVARIDRLEQRIDEVDERAERMVDRAREQLGRDVVMLKDSLREHRDYGRHY